MKYETTGQSARSHRISDGAIGRNETFWNLATTFKAFVKAGEKVSKVVATATDWQMMVALGRGLLFPGEVTYTSLRPDIVICTVALMQVVVIYLTVS